MSAAATSPPNLSVNGLIVLAKTERDCQNCKFMNKVLLKFNHHLMIFSSDADIAAGIQICTVLKKIIFV